MNMKAIAVLLTAIFLISAIAVMTPTVKAEELIIKQEITITGKVKADVKITGTEDTVTYDIKILDTAPHYGVGIAFATSTEHPDFQVWFREYETPYGWYYQEWTGDGWHGWGGTVIPLSDMGWSAKGSNTTPTFSVTVPTTTLGRWGATYYYGIQVRTNLINHYPPDFSWTSHEAPSIQASYTHLKLIAPPPVGALPSPAQVQAKDTAGDVLAFIETGVATGENLDYNGDGVVNVADAFDNLVDHRLIAEPTFSFDPTTGNTVLTMLQGIYGTNLEHYPTVEGRVWLLYMLG